VVMSSYVNHVMVTWMTVSRKGRALRIINLGKDGYISEASVVGGDLVHGIVHVHSRDSDNYADMNIVHIKPRSKPVRWTTVLFCPHCGLRLVLQGRHGLSDLPKIKDILVQRGLAKV